MVKEERNKRKETNDAFDEETGPEVSFALKKAEKRIEQLRQSEQKLIKSRKTLEDLTCQLKERVKELNCLYTISSIVEKQGLTLEEVLQQTVDVIPIAWQYPEIACSRIVLGNLEFQSASFTETGWRQSQPIILHGKTAGFLDVFYGEEKAERDEGPFLKEERSLIKVIAERVGEIVVRKRAEEALQESESKNRALLDAIPDLMFQLNEEGVLMGFHPGQFDISRFLPVQVVGRNLYDLPEIRKYLPKRTLDQIMVYVKRTLDSDRVQVFEQNIAFNSERKDFEIRMVACSRDQVLAIVRDTTHKKRLEREILEISGREQRRIGQDLHDSLCQHLAGIGFMGKVLEKKIVDNKELEAADVTEIVSLIDQAITMTRGFARGLNPVMLKADGLVMALSQLAANVQKLFGISCRFDDRDKVLITDNAVATHIYRIVQEALNNAIKHGKADTVTIKLGKCDDILTLTVEDNGCGFSRAMSQGKGMGLNIMQYRASMIGASLDIRDGAAGGTVVTCSFQNRNEALNRPDLI